MIVQFKEWKSSLGWTCAPVDSFSPNIDNWILPARALNISFDQYVNKVITDFKPDTVAFSTYFGCWWKNQSDMRKFKNWVNKALREANINI